MSDVLEVRGATVAIGTTPIVFDVSLSLARGGIACLLGPSGCGKTTLLRAIAGFAETIRGEIRIDDRLVSASNVLVPVEQRDVGMVFQDFALFPHLTVAGNIGFGIERQGRTARVAEVARMLDVEALLGAYPHMLSGGQQQRVAVARAMAPRPRILLLDEPFSGLDVELREQIARDIRGVLKSDGITAIMVTHNQVEAFAMADNIGLMRAGRLLQWGTARDLYYRPVTREVANFIGEGRFLPGSVLPGGQVQTPAGTFNAPETASMAVDMPVDVLIRPDMVTLDASSDLQATVVEAVFRGAETATVLALPGGFQLLALAPGAMALTPGMQTGVRIALEGAVVFGIASEAGRTT